VGAVVRALNTDAPGGEFPDHLFMNVPELLGRKDSVTHSGLVGNNKNIKSRVGQRFHGGGSARLKAELLPALDVFPEININDTVPVDKNYFIHCLRHSRFSHSLYCDQSTSRHRHPEPRHQPLVILNRIPNPRHPEPHPHPPVILNEVKDLSFPRCFASLSMTTVRHPEPRPNHPSSCVVSPTTRHPEPYPQSSSS